MATLEKISAKPCQVNEGSKRTTPNPRTVYGRLSMSVMCFLAFVMTEGVCDLELLMVGQGMVGRGEVAGSHRSARRAVFEISSGGAHGQLRVILRLSGGNLQTATSNIGETNPLDFGSCLVLGLVNRTDDLCMRKNGLFVAMRLACHGILFLYGI